MPLQRGDFVRVTYTMKVKDGPVIETTEEPMAKEMGLHKEGATYGPRTVILGANSVIPGLEEALLGKDAGAKGSITVPPEKGFGPRQPDRIETFTVTRFPEPPYPGMEVSLEGRHGLVETVIGRRARVDFNHPLAGKTLVYDYTVVERLDGPQKKLEALAKLVLPIPAEVSIQDSVGTVRLPAEVPPNLPVGIFRLLAEQAFEHLALKEFKVEARFPNPKSKPPAAPLTAPTSETPPGGEPPGSTRSPPASSGASKRDAGAPQPSGASGSTPPTRKKEGAKTEAKGPK